MPKGDIAKTLTDILFNIDEISGKINDKNIILLEQHMILLKRLNQKLLKQHYLI